jgi:hypothetical protein
MAAENSLKSHPQFIILIEIYTCRVLCFDVFAHLKILQFMN